MSLWHHFPGSQKAYSLEKVTILFVKMDIHNINSLTALCLDGLNKSNTFYYFFSPKNFAAYHYAWGQNNIFQEDLITSNVMT